MYTLVKRLFIGVIGVVDCAGVDRAGIIPEVVVSSGIGFIAEVVFEPEKVVGGDIEKFAEFYNSIGIQIKFFAFVLTDITLSCFKYYRQVFLSELSCLTLFADYLSVHYSVTSKIL